MLVFNEGPTDITGAVITDRMPAGALFFGATDSGSESDGIVEWAGVDLPAYSFVERRFAITDPFALTDVITNADYRVSSGAASVGGNVSVVTELSTNYVHLPVILKNH